MKQNVVYVDRILWPVTALGPGKRVAIWVCGCGHHCPGCANPELWERKPEQAVSVEKFADMLHALIQEKKPDGITITGGEPFDQAGALSEVLNRLEGKQKDILIYSGYTKEQIEKNERRKELLSRVDVLIDGTYIEEQNQPSAVLRGSENQKIYYQNESLKETYASYMEQGRQIQNFVYDYRILSVGIHNRGEENGGGKVGKGAESIQSAE